MVEMTSSTSPPSCGLNGRLLASDDRCSVTGRSLAFQPFAQGAAVRRGRRRSAGSGDDGRHLTGGLVRNKERYGPRGVAYDRYELDLKVLG